MAELDLKPAPTPVPATAPAQIAAGTGAGARAVAPVEPLAKEVAAAVEAAKSARRLQDLADALKEQARLTRDPAERERLWTSAYNNEVEAHGQTRKARAMASGWGQGAAAGVGIGAAVGMGLGNLVGALLSSVVAIPGVLVGSGVGALHGPWYRLGPGALKKGKSLEPSEVDSEVSDEHVHRAIIEAARKVEEEDRRS